MSKEKKGNELIPNLGDIATTVIFKWIEFSFELGENVKKWVDKLLDWKTYLKQKPWHKDPLNVDEYVPEISKAQKINIEITDEIKDKLVDLVDFFTDDLSDWVIEELDNIIFNWNPDFSKLFAHMEIDSEENEEIYKQLIAILQEIKIS